MTAAALPSSLSFTPIETEVLGSRLSEIWRREDQSRFRPALLAALREALAEGRAAVRNRFEAGGTGADCVRDNAAMIDAIVCALADVTVHDVFETAGPTSGEQLAIVAVGGYGRGEMAPFSDIDLMFLLPWKRTPRVEQIVEYMLYVLWDLGLKVGHSVRSTDEAIRQANADLTIRTALLETRHLWGDMALFRGFRKRFQREAVHGQGPTFIEGKLAERDARHQRLGDTRYVLEPNLKEGKGGLRDLQTLFWIAKYLYEVDEVRELVRRGVLLMEEARRFAKAQNFLWTARCHLHYLTGRAEERLTFDVQALIGSRMGYTDHAGARGVERFMKHYFLVAKDVGDLTRIFCAALEADWKRPRRLSIFRRLRVEKEIQGFVIDGDRLSVRDEGHFRTRPADMIRLFHTAHVHGIDVHPAALRAITRALSSLDNGVREDPEANGLFLEILTGRKDPEVTLRRMNEAGVLGRFVPDFGRVVAQMQYDMYHVYTVDEHTLQAVGILHKIEAGALKEVLPFASEVVQKVVSRRALMVAVFLHDIAKGRGGDHSVLGAKVAERLGPRFGLTVEETETAAWLVRWHLALSSTAFKRDVDDETTIRDMVELVQSPERLRQLLVLTTADVSAVGPGRWNAWKATLLQNLFANVEERLVGGFGEVQPAGPTRGMRVRRAQDALRGRLKDWAEDEIEAHLGLGYPAYWLAFDAVTHERQARLMRRARRDGSPLNLDTRVDRARAVTEITLYTPDHPGLFARLAGAFAVSGATIVDARIFTMADGMALDVFSVQDAAGGSFASADRLAKLAVNVERTLSGEMRPLQELARRKPTIPARTRVFRVPPRVLIDNAASSTHTVIEVNGKDRPGLLYDLTRSLTGLSLQIASARISTYGAQVIDVFYVRDLFGLKVTHKGQLARIRERLLEALTDPEEIATPSTPRSGGAARNGGGPNG
jgi:[protein-PII] uridylyltransferase